MGMREQAIEAFARLVWRTEKSPEAHFPILKRELVRQAERALTAEVALAEARELIQKAIDHVDEWSGTDNFIERMAAWLESNKKES